MNKERINKIISHINDITARFKISLPELKSVVSLLCPDSLRDGRSSLKESDIANAIGRVRDRGWKPSESEITESQHTRNTALNIERVPKNNVGGTYYAAQDCSLQKKKRQ